MMCNETKKTYAWYDMEQQIMKCWEVVSDMQIIADSYDDAGMKGTLHGIAELYDKKFEKLWAYYEQATHERFEERKKHGSEE